MNTYRNSGSFGDIIYSLCIIPKLGAGNYQVAMNNLANVSKHYHQFGLLDLMPIHRDYINETHYNLLAPLLERQPYIKSVSKWYPGDPNPENLIDTDAFRGIFGKRVDNNFISMFYAVSGIPFTKENYSDVWLEADKKSVSPYVVARTERYRNPDNHATAYYKAMAQNLQFDKNAVFIGTPQEHQSFIADTGVNIPHYKITNFLEFAEVINGAESFIGNQTLGFSLAVGLGKPAALEIKPTQTLTQNECWFDTRPNITYF